MTTIAKRALAFLESLDDDALLAFVEEAIGTKLSQVEEEPDQSGWIMGGATEYFTFKAQRESVDRYDEVDGYYHDTPIAAGTFDTGGTWPSSVDEVALEWEMHDDTLLNYQYAPDVTDAA